MTTLNAAVDSSLKTIRGINENIAKLQEEAKAARKAAVEPFLEALAAICLAPRISSAWLRSSVLTPVACHHVTLMW